MAQTIKIKGNVSNALAVPSSLIERELAANFAARTLFGSDGKGVFQFYTGTDKYFDTSGYANNANKLGGQSIDYFASAEGVADSLAEIIDTLSDYVNEIATSGSGNAITSVSKSGKKLTFTKGATYLTGITSALVTGALGYTPYDAANFTKAKIKSTLGISDWALASSKPSYAFAELTNKPATLSGYGITDAYTASQIDTKLGDYLPLSGGTLTGGLTLSTGNFVVRKGDTVTGKLYPLNDGETLLGQEARRWSDIKTVLINGGTPINSENIGSQRVASAAKLTTARTIWGQSFDGTGNVSGDLSLGTAKLRISDASSSYNIAFLSSTYGLYIGDGTSSIYDTLLWGQNINLVTGTNGQPRVYVKNDGNVGIGTTSPQYKLDVNGTLNASGAATLGSMLSVSGLATLSGGVSTNKITIGNGTIEWDETNKGFKIVGGLYTESYLSAKGANSSGSSSSGGLVTSIWKEDNLGDTFNKSANDTFNAYAINSIHNRVSVLEGKATNVTYSQTQTSGTALGVITIDGASKTIYAPTIPTADINKGVTAYGWGNHANAGYLTQHQDLSGYQTKITSSNKLAYSLISGTPTLSAVATSGKYSDLSGTPTIPTALKSPYALTFGSKTYDGSSAKTIVASDLGALTAHQTIYALTIKNSAETTQLTYTPNSAAGSLTLTKAMVGLGNVENTALSTWKGTSNITTLGTITSGTWNGTKIANSYLANSAITIAGTSVSLGGSITATTLQSNLGLGALAYKGSLSFAELTNKPTTLSGYGITDAYTASQIDTKLDGYLPSSSYTAADVLAKLKSVDGAGSGLDADTLDGCQLRNILECTQSGEAAPKAVGWYRIANFKKPSAQGDVCTLYIYRTYNNVDNESYIFNIAYNYKHGYSITQVAGNYNTRLITKIRIDSISSTTLNACIDIYYNKAEGNTIRWFTVGTAESLTSATLIENPTGTPIEFETGKGCISSHGFTGALTGNASSATKLATARTIWGQSFDGTGNVSGAMSGVTTLNASGAVTLGSTLSVASAILLTGTSASTSTIAFGRVGANYITVPSGGILYIGHGSSAAASMYHFTDEHFIAYMSATTLGNTSSRWATIYGVNGDYSGTVYATTGIWSDGYVSAKGQNTSSDIRLKNVLGDVELGVSAIANAPSIRFAWKNGGGIDVGSSAQYWQKLLPDAVKERDGRLEMQYANIALLSAIAIAKRVETHEERIERLEREVKELRIENVELKNKIGGIYGE